MTLEVPTSSNAKADWGPGGMESGWTEHQHQAQVVALCDTEAMRDRRYGLLYAIPNGYKKSVAMAANAKREGLRAGVPDLVLPVAARGYNGLYVEMKKQGGSADVKQREWHERLNEQGYLALTRWGWRDAWTLIRWYLS